jgi:Tfp pilus assembly protein PilF
MGRSKHERQGVCMRQGFRWLGVLLFLLGSVAWAAGGGGGSSGAGSSGGGGGGGSKSVVKDPVIQAAQDGIARQDWLGVQALLKKALASNPANADYHNLYAFSTRKGPNPDMALVLAEYAEALRIDPKHRGAHEYLGEAYLQMQDLPKAREQLAALDKLCTFGCEEYSDLKRALKQYETAHPQ